MGGLSEKANTLNKIWKNTKGRLINVDAGNLLFKRNGKFSPESKEVITAEAIAEIYNELGFDAVSVGGNDLSGGIDLLVGTKNNGVPWTSANLYNSANERIFEPYRIKYIDNLSIAIVGATGPSARQFAEIHFKDAATELATLLPELERSFDLILLLASMSFKDTIELVKQFNQIDIAIAADNGNNNIAPLLLGSTLVTQTGNRGRYLGVLSVTWTGQPWGENPHSTLLNLRTRLKTVSLQLSKIQNNQWDAVSQKEKIAQLKDSRAEITQHIEQLEKEINSGSSQIEFSTYECNFLPLTKSGRIDPQIDYIIRDAKKRIERGGTK